MPALDEDGKINVELVAVLHRDGLLVVELFYDVISGVSSVQSDHRISGRQD